MKRTIVMDTFTLMIRLFLGFLFLYASLDKIIQPVKFAEIVYNYRILPVELLNIVAVVIPWIEAGIGFSLLIGVCVETASFILNVMTIFFIGLIISAITRGLNIECGCFSLNEQGSLVSWKRVFEDVLILIGGIIVMMRSLAGKDISKFRRDVEKTNRKGLL